MQAVYAIRFSRSSQLSSTCQARHHGRPITVQITPAGPLSSAKPGQDAVLVHQSAAFCLCGTHLTQNLKQDFTSFLFSSCSPVSFLISSSYFLLHLSLFFLFGSFLIAFLLSCFSRTFFFISSSSVFCIKLLLFLPQFFFTYLSFFLLPVVFFVSSKFSSLLSFSSSLLCNCSSFSSSSPVSFIAFQSFFCYLLSSSAVFFFFFTF